VREFGSGTRLAVEEFLRQAGLPIEAGVELGSDSGAVKQAVMAGLGVSVLSSGDRPGAICRSPGHHAGRGFATAA